jgi:hypothetical protein
LAEIDSRFMAGDVPGESDPGPQARSRVRQSRGHAGRDRRPQPWRSSKRPDRSRASAARRVTGGARLWGLRPPFHFGRFF